MTSAQVKAFFLKRYDEVLLSPTWIKVALALLLLKVIF